MLSAICILACLFLMAVVSHTQGNDGAPLARRTSRQPGRPTANNGRFPEYPSYRRNGHQTLANLSLALLRAVGDRR